MEAKSRDQSQRVFPDLVCFVPLQKRQNLSVFLPTENSRRSSPVLYPGPILPEIPGIHEMHWVRNMNSSDRPGSPVRSWGRRLCGSSGDHNASDFDNDSKQQNSETPPESS